MAKKRKKQEELKAEKDWKAPEFDKAEFMRSEINVAKGTIYAAILAIPMALVAMFIIPVGGAGGGFLIGLAGISFLWFILPLFKVDVKAFKITHWLGTISTYFFLFLAVWVMLCNPPFNDFASPAIRNVEVSWDNGNNWTTVNASDTGGMVIIIPSNATANTTMMIQAQVSDNVELNVNTVTLTIGADTPEVMTSIGDNLFQSEVPDPMAGMYFTISGTDTNGNDPGTFEFSVIA